MALNETDILSSKAIIFQNDFRIWQFRCCVSEEKQNVRKSLKTKDIQDAIALAEVMWSAINGRIRNNKKIFSKLIKEAIGYLTRDWLQPNSLIAVALVLHA